MTAEMLRERSSAWDTWREDGSRVREAGCKGLVWSKQSCTKCPEEPARSRWPQFVVVLQYERWNPEASTHWVSPLLLTYRGITTNCFDPNAVQLIMWKHGYRVDAQCT